MSVWCVTAGQQASTSGRERARWMTERASAFPASVLCERAKAWGGSAVREPKARAGNER